VILFFSDATRDTLGMRYVGDAICADSLRSSERARQARESARNSAPGIELLSRVHERANEGAFRRSVISRNHAAEVSTAVFVSFRPDAIAPDPAV